MNPPYYPIIYVRGYAGTQDAVEDTVATPYMGFNLGSTRYRQTAAGKIEPYVFESPLIRLMKDHQYQDAYHDGQILPQGPVSPQSIWIFRYYDVVSKELGGGERKEIEFHAEKLRQFILHIRSATGQESNKNFRVYLVAHSMGGLVCRCYLQNDNIPDLEGKPPRDWTKKGVDKLFTYATPHGGIEFRKGFGWLEGLRDFLAINNADNFGEHRMREILSLKKNTPLHSLNNRFPANRVFCLVGTNSQDYGIARKVVGPKSDGLVQIENAYIKEAARAYTFRSHSGAYGIVNSESGYRNLERFLFGDTQVKVSLETLTIQMPGNEKNLSATYDIESRVSIRGLPIPVNTRTKDTFSASFRSSETLENESTHLFTSFLLKSARLNKRRQSLGFSIHFRILPLYHQNHNFLPDRHYEGQAVFDDRLIIEVSKTDKTPFAVRYGWGSNNLKATKPLEFSLDKNNLSRAVIQLNQRRPVNLTAKIRFEVSAWNQ
jgi:PGAP1-like protein